MTKVFSQRRELTAVIFLVLMFLIVGLINPSFLNLKNILLCFNGSVVYTIVAIGIAFVIMTGEIDVSVGANVGITAALAGSMIRDGKPWELAILSALSVGILIGLINGIGITVFRIPSIIMTLGTNGIIRGLIYVYTDGKWVENIPFNFKVLAQKTLLNGFTYFYLSVVILMVLVHIVLNKTKRGKYPIAVGDNAAAANLLGIPVYTTKLLTFVICGLFSAIGGVLYVSRVGFITPIAGNGYEMKVIAACVLGGISLSGGVGSVIGAGLGAAIMASMSRVLVFIGLSSDFDDTITGVMLIVIVVVDAILRKNSIEQARRQRLAAKVQKSGEVL